MSEGPGRWEDEKGEGKRYITGEWTGGGRER